MSSVGCGPSSSSTGKREGKRQRHRRALRRERQIDPEQRPRSPPRPAAPAGRASARSPPAVCRTRAPAPAAMTSAKNTRAPSGSSANVAGAAGCPATSRDPETGPVSARLMNMRVEGSCRDLLPVDLAKQCDCQPRTVVIRESDNQHCDSHLTAISGLVDPSTSRLRRSLRVSRSGTQDCDQADKSRHLHGISSVFRCLESAHASQRSSDQADYCRDLLCSVSRRLGRLPARIRRSSGRACRG